MPPQALDYATERYLENELKPGEKLKWNGAPSPGLMALKAMPATISAVLFLGVALFMFSRAGARSPDISKLGGFAFILAVPGLILAFMMAAPLFAIGRARRTIYAVTDQRALILQRSLGGSFSLRSFLPQELGATRRDEKPDGSGNIILSYDLVSTKNGQQRREIGFFGVPDVKTVFEWVQSLAKTVPSGGFSPLRPYYSPGALRSVAIVGSVFIAIGLGIAFFGIRNLIAGKASVHWPVASAVILTSRINSVKGGHQPLVTYRFQVGDRMIVGNRLSFGNASGSLEWARGVADRYAVGNVVDARYDPSNPRNCVLLPGVAGVVLILPFFGLFFAGMGGLCLFASRRAARAQNRGLG